MKSSKQTYPSLIQASLGLDTSTKGGQVDYFVCIKGAIKICAYDDETQELNEIISTGENPRK